MSVTDIINKIIETEGRYVNNFDDRGGETNFGITFAVARANGYTGPMRSMQRETAFKIYLNQYFEDPGFDKVNQIDQLIAEELTDTGVNMGPTTAAKFLQRSLNLLNRQGKDWPDLVVDGKIGRMTLDALQTLLRHRPTGRKVLFKLLNVMQGARYVELAEKDPSQETFMFGWIDNRVQ